MIYNYKIYRINKYLNTHGDNITTYWLSSNNYNMFPTPNVEWLREFKRKKVFELEFYDSA